MENKKQESCRVVVSNNIKKTTDWIDPTTGQKIENPLEAKKRARFGGRLINR